MTVCNKNNTVHTPEVTHVLREFQCAPLLGLPSPAFGNLMASPFTPSTSSPRSPFRWTCGWAWDQHHNEEWVHFRYDCCSSGQHTTCKLERAIGCWYTSLLPVLSWEGDFVRRVFDSFHKASPSRAAPTIARRRLDRAPGRRTSESSTSSGCRTPAESHSSRSRRAASDGATLV